MLYVQILIFNVRVRKEVRNIANMKKINCTFPCFCRSLHLHQICIFIVWAKGDRYKNLVSYMWMPEFSATDSFFILQQCYRIFPIDKLDYYGFIVPSTIP